MNPSRRRVFMAQALTGSAAFIVTRISAQGAAATELISESDSQAVALGYKADTRKVDAKKYAQHSVTQTCGNCQLFVGKTSEPAGACAVFPGKKVATPGWCSAWVKQQGT